MACSDVIGTARISEALQAASSGTDDYSLFEVLHFGLRLPGVLSSFGDVPSASVSNWATVEARPRPRARPGRGIARRTRAPWRPSRARGSLRRAADVLDADFSDLSFYAFWRQYDVVAGRLVRKRREKVVAVTGTGWPSHAKRSHRAARGVRPQDPVRVHALRGAGRDGVRGRGRAGALRRELRRARCRPSPRTAQMFRARQWVRRNYEVAQPRGQQARR
jgi:hypothetical protein